MSASVFLLMGFMGTGKLTIAREIERTMQEHGHTVLLIDNHYVNNPIFAIIHQDGMTHLPLDVWDRVAEVRNAIVLTLETLTPGEWSVIFTNDLVEGDDDRAWSARVAALAEARGNRFVPVRLLCDVEELARRVATPERRDRMKGINPDDARRRHAKLTVHDPRHPNTLTLDVTDLPPDEAASRILAHAASIDPF